MRLQVMDRSKFEDLRPQTGLDPAVRRHPEQWYPFGEVYADLE